ncbi:MAG: metallophosphoesterase [Candidatus Woesearchaeota archaeon]
MHLLENAQIHDLGLIIGDTLIIADLHLGYEEAMARNGYMIPRYQFSETVKRILDILEKAPVKKIVIAGDLTHEFSRVSRQERKDTKKLLDLLKRKYEVVLVRGNHDTMTPDMEEQFLLGNTLITHGHKIPDIPNEVETIVIGHEHPAISIGDNIRRELYKCFLFGRYEGYNLIVLPSFNQVTEGTDVSKEELLSPFLKEGVLDFDVFIVGFDETYHFGTVFQASL